MVEAVCQQSQSSRAATQPSSCSLPSTWSQEELDEGTWRLKEALQAALPELTIGSIIGSGGISTCFEASVPGSSELRAVKVTHRGAPRDDNNSFVAKLAEVLHLLCTSHMRPSLGAACMSCYLVSPRRLACMHPQSCRPEAGHLLPKRTSACMSACSFCAAQEEASAYGVLDDEAEQLPYGVARTYQTGRVAIGELVHFFLVMQRLGDDLETLILNGTISKHTFLQVRMQGP
jgi:hypothetical protein